MSSQVAALTAMAKLKINHPTRLRIVTHLLDAPTASPNEISKLGDSSLGATAYHFRALRDLELIALARESRVRGAVEHHYKLTAAGRRQVKKVLAA